MDFGASSQRKLAIAKTGFVWIISYAPTHHFTLDDTPLSFATPNL
jgi:hypothetical protein